MTPLVSLLTLLIIFFGTTLMTRPQLRMWLYLGLGALLSILMTLAESSADMENYIFIYKNVCTYGLSDSIVNEKFFNLVVFVFGIMTDCEPYKLFKFILGFLSFFLIFFCLKGIPKKYEKAFILGVAVFFFLPHFIENTFHLARQSISTCLFLIGLIYHRHFFILLACLLHAMFVPLGILYIVLVYRSIKLLLATLVSSIILYSFEILGYLVKRFESINSTKDLGEIVSGSLMAVVLLVGFVAMLSYRLKRDEFRSEHPNLVGALALIILLSIGVNLLWLMGFELVSFRYALVVIGMAPLALAFLPLERVGLRWAEHQIFLAVVLASQLIWFQARDVYGIFY